MSINILLYQCILPVGNINIAIIIISYQRISTCRLRYCIDIVRISHYIKQHQSNRIHQQDSINFTLTRTDCICSGIFFCLYLIETNSDSLSASIHGETLPRHCVAFDISGRISEVQVDTSNLMEHEVVRSIWFWGIYPGKIMTSWMILKVSM